jgi:hypothetical protein
VDVIEFHTVPGEQLPIVAPVNRGQRVETKDTGDNSLGLDIGQTAGGNGKFLARQPPRNLETSVLNIAHRAPERFPRSTKFVSTIELHKPCPFGFLFDKCNKECRFFLSWKSKIRRLSVRILERLPTICILPKFRPIAETFGSSGSVPNLETTCSYFVTGRPRGREFTARLQTVDPSIPQVGVAIGKPFSKCRYRNRSLRGIRATLSFQKANKIHPSKT